MFRKKNGQEFIDENGVESSTNEKKEKKGLFHKKKKKDINLYEDDMGYIEDDRDFLEDEYEKELEELQEEEQPKKRRGFFRRKKKDVEEASEVAKTEELGNSTDEEQSLLSDDDAIILQEPEKKKFSKKKLALICGTAAVIVIAVVFFVIRNMGGTSEGKAYVESVREITGLGTSAGANNRYTGTVDAEKSWKITLQSDMSVEKRYVNVGDQVKKGDKLFKYNTQELKLSKEKKELEQEIRKRFVAPIRRQRRKQPADRRAEARVRVRQRTHGQHQQGARRQDRGSDARPHGSGAFFSAACTKKLRQRGNCRPDAQEKAPEREYDHAAERVERQKAAAPAAEQRVRPAKHPVDRVGVEQKKRQRRRDRVDRRVIAAAPCLSDQPDAKRNEHQQAAEPDPAFPCAPPSAAKQLGHGEEARAEHAQPDRPGGKRRKQHLNVAKCERIHQKSGDPLRF